MTSLQKVGHRRLQRAPAKSELSCAEVRAFEEWDLMGRSKNIQEVSYRGLKYFASTCGKRPWATMHEHIETEMSRCIHVLSHLKNHVATAHEHVCQETIRRIKDVRSLSTFLRSRRRHSRTFSPCQFEGEKCADCTPAWMRLPTWISLPCKHQNES